MFESIKCIEKYAEEYKTDCFSLDMWRTETEGKHWSFGITYINGKIDWVHVILSRCTDLEYQYMDTDGNKNIDWYFTYLKNETSLKIETFYLENLKFIHYSHDFFTKPIGSGLYHWAEGKLIYPIIYYGIGVKELGQFNIAEDVIKLDIGIADNEATDFLTYFARDGRDLSSYGNWSGIVNRNLCNIKYQEFIKRDGLCKIADEDMEIVGFGAGGAFRSNIKKISQIGNVKYVCDNDENKWGKDLGYGIRCISPSELQNMDNVLVVIMVYSKKAISEIAKQLVELGIQNYVDLDSWLMCAE